MKPFRRGRRGWVDGVGLGEEEKRKQEDELLYKFGTSRIFPYGERDQTLEIEYPRSFFRQTDDGHCIVCRRLPGEGGGAKTPGTLSESEHKSGPRGDERWRWRAKASLMSLLCLRPPFTRAHSHILFVFFMRFPPNAALVIDAEIYDGADFRLSACLGERFLKCSGVL